MTLGALNYGTGRQNYLDGILDEIILYNRTLTPLDLCNSYLAFCLSEGPDPACDTSCVGD